MREIDTLAAAARDPRRAPRAEAQRRPPDREPDDPVLITATGRARDPLQPRRRRRRVVRRADELQALRGGQPLPLGISPHKLRHTFASILVAIDKDPNYVMNQLGHTDAGFTLPSTAT